MPDKENEKSIKALKNAFEFFSETTLKLENAYKLLESRVNDLNVELDKKNKELSVNLAEINYIRNHLKNILESMKMGVVAVNLDGKITVFNNSAQEITGLKSADMIGRFYEDVYSEQVDNSFTLLKTLKEGKEFANEEKEIKDANGSLIPVEYSTSLVKSEYEEVLGAVEMFSDMTEIKKLEKEVQRARTLAALGEMAANVAHEIRNPLGGIGGFAALLERDLDIDDPRRNLVKKIIEGVSRLNRIAANLLFYTRPIEPRLQKQDIIKTIDDVLLLMEVELEQEERNIEIIRDFPSNIQEVRIDPEIFQQVLLNIFKNAADSMENEGKLIVGVKGKNDEKNIVISVEDNGIGMSESVQERLFNPFFTTKPNGTGLGLAITKKIIDIHKGEISVKSEEGKGTLFEISLPV